jgi:acetylornithine aminotransferase
LANVNARGEQLRSRLETIKNAYPALFTEVRGWGLINGLEISGESSLTSIDVVKAAMEAGLLIAPAGPKVLRFVPPLIVSEAEVATAADILAAVIARLAA